MELKIYAMMGREIALEYKQHRKDMEFMGPVRVSDVEAAQAHFVRIAERLGEDRLFISLPAGTEPPQQTANTGKSRFRTLLLLKAE